MAWGGLQGGRAPTQADCSAYRRAYRRAIDGADRCLRTCPDLWMAIAARPQADLALACATRALSAWRA
eukprot:8334486-Alexandrium_andersonii.AAC.1